MAYVRNLAPAAPAPAAVPADVRWMNAFANGIALLGAALLFAALVMWLARQPMFAIRAISIDGDTARNSVSTIRANAMPRVAGSFMQIDLRSVRRAFEGVPWVRKAVVQRVWPNRLRVRLEEHRPVALWLDPQADDARASERLVNSHGEVFEANVGDVEDDELPVLSGPAGSSAHLLAMHGRLAPVMAPLGPKLEQLALSSRGSWTATLEGDVPIELGRGSDDELVARAERFVASVPQVTGRMQRPLESADLRHADGYAVRLRGVTTLPDPKSAQQKKKGGAAWRGN